MPRTLPAATWADKIHSLRRSLKFSQTDFSRRFNVSAMTVSRWERGMQAPSTDVYLELGKLAGPGAGWYFWNMAGLRESDVGLMIRKTNPCKDHRIAKIIVTLETQAALSEAQSKRIAATRVNLPTVALRREYRTMSDMDAAWAKVIRNQAAMLRQVYAGNARRPQRRRLTRTYDRARSSGI